MGFWSACEKIPNEIGAQKACRIRGFANMAGFKIYKADPPRGKPVMKPKRIIAIWDHSFHQKTKSSAFLEDVLKEEFEVVYYWDESWHGGNMPDTDAINSLEPYCIFFWQRIPAPAILKRIKCQNRIWVPMRDCHPPYPAVRWFKYMGSKIKILSFCRENHSVIKKYWPHAVLYLQYYPLPLIQNTEAEKSAKLKVLFWQRAYPINWRVVRRLIKPEIVDELFFRRCPDPGHSIKMPSGKDIAEYKIKFIDGWLEKDAYTELLKSCNVFIAPRQFEGIGIGFLWAMSSGACVVSPDNPVANEYITHNVNGVLYNLENPQAVDLSNARTYGAYALLSIKNGRAQWDAEKYRILDLVNKSNSILSNFYGLLLYGIYCALYPMRPIYEKYSRNRL